MSLHPVPNDAAPDPDPSPREHGEPLNPIRLRHARRVSEARAVPVLTVVDEVDLAAVDELCARHGESFERRHDAALDRLAFVASAVLGALAQHPVLNSELRHDVVIRRDHCDLGVPLGAGGGTVLAVVRDAARLPFGALAAAITRLSRRAATGRLAPEDLHGATFTLSDAGPLGALLSTPGLEPSQSGTLGLHAVRERPVAVGGRVEVRPMMYLALAFDERLVDAAAGASFLRAVRAAVEDPVRALLGA